jgi:regulator of sigma E protease
VSWLLAFAGFALLIILHEFGHFIAAKWTGMRVERFFLFFPPKLWSFKRGETEYGIGWLPLGGFVKITGMNPDEVDPPPGQEEKVREVGLLEKVESVDQNPDPDVSVPGQPLPPELRERAYYNQPVWKRIVVIAAGPAMNVLVAFVLLFGLAYTAEEISGPGLEIAELTTDSPAQGQLEEGDKVVSIDGMALADQDGGERADNFRDQIGTHTCAGTPTEGCEAETPVQVVVERDGERVPVAVTPKYDPGAEQALMGVRFEPTDLTSVNPSPVEAAEFAVDRMWYVTSQTVTILARIIDPEQREQISGVVGSYEATRQAINLDAQLAIGILAVISLSLAIINLFPFLPLDGGHIFWSVVEKIRGRRVPFSVMEKSGAIGFVLILLLAFIGLSNDIDRLTSDEGLGIRER